MYISVFYLCTTAVDGNWGSWQQWGECSASCGGGERTRTRLCNNPSPSNGGRPCPGDSSQLSRCNAQACPGETFVACCTWLCPVKCSFLKFIPFLLSGGPQAARGSIIGNINDIEFGIAILNASVTDSNTGGRLITATITNVPRTLGQLSDSFFYLNPLFFMHFDIHQLDFNIC